MVLISHAVGAKLRCPPGVHYCVGRTMFETDSVPASWVSQCNAMDEVWVPSVFNLVTFARAGVHPRKLRVVQEGVSPLVLAYQPSRLNFSGCAPGDVIFLSIFEWSARKGGDLLLRAFAESFTSRDAACLVVKAHIISANVAGAGGGTSVAALVRRFQARLERPDPPRFHFLFGHQTEEGLLDMHASADVFVLPSRGEGWGRPYADAMGMGVPVIATCAAALPFPLPPFFFFFFCCVKARGQFLRPRRRDVRRRSFPSRCPLCLSGPPSPTTRRIAPVGC